MTSTPLTEGRRADSSRRRQRVTEVIKQAAKRGDDLSASAIARQAGVDRTFLYRHRDLLELLHTAAATPASTVGTDGAAVTKASLQADLANALERNTRVNTRVRLLEKKLSEVLGEQVWRESGLGAPEDIDHLKRTITTLEQQVVDLKGQLEEQAADLDAARGANRELTRTLNQARSR
ncbi:hypothetical protein J7E99_19930 [Streptomyces sp. ISL-44]|uniref:DUF6262 family protein n=1 Tax=Streptomyces sp. ISL-44 TaxID=2819184 RepID=UPI001BE6ACEE|nr:DUF6262 family protein [Streptomyces sp. ISL-44]MBT2542913.1 hypothetical protein [Streptomyces sp. ISL-44]